MSTLRFTQLDVFTDTAPVTSAMARVVGGLSHVR